jgi:type VI secretion system protein ImpF
MADLAPQERLQPSLLDRLTDERPDERVEPRERRVMSMRRLRECVLRDLSWLLNADNLAQTEDLGAYPLAAASTINFGMRDLAGVALSEALVAEYERELRQAILDFEPRIIPRTLVVRAIVEADAADQHALSFEIEGEIWADPVPMRVLLRTDVDVESGEASVRETAGARAG